MCNRREQAVSVLPRLVDAGPRFITDRVERVVFPLGSAGEEDNAFSVRDEHRLAGLGPIRFQSRKVQLHHYDACRTTFGTRRLRKKIPWYARSDADAVETSSAICQRLPKIRTESIRDSDEAFRLVPVARRDGDTALVNRIKRGRAGSAIHCFELAIHSIAEAFVAGRLQHREHVVVARQHHR